MEKYHVFFTTKYTETCLQYCCFGASVSNSLANVKAGDITFLFDGLKWAIFGPFEIVSAQQLVDLRPIYGKDKRGIVRYKNRVWFTTESAKKTSIVALYSTEREPSKKSFILNRYLIATLIANKQVNATTLTQSEGLYLKKKCISLGENISSTYSKIPPSAIPVFPDHILRKPISEAGVETLILNKKCNGYLLEFLNSFSDHSVYFNQFVLGFQRQVDLLVDAFDKIAVFEIKKTKNPKNPFEQLLEYSYYCLSSFRLHHNRSHLLKSIHLVGVIERGNMFLKDEFVKTFEIKCSEIANIEGIQIIPHTILYNVSDQLLETEQYEIK